MQAHHDHVDVAVVVGAGGDRAEHVGHDQLRHARAVYRGISPRSTQRLSQSHLPSVTTRSCVRYEVS